MWPEVCFNVQAIVVLALDGAWAAYDFIQEQMHKGGVSP